MTLVKLEWNNVDLGEDGRNGLRDGLISLVTFSADRSPMLIGTAFIVGALGNSAVAVTAAHNFQAILDTQNPYQRHNLTALSEFLPKSEPVNLNNNFLGAMCVSQGLSEICAIDWVSWEPKSDIAFFLVTRRDLEKKDFFNIFYQLEPITPKIGDEIMIVGYAEMAITDKKSDETGCTDFTMYQKLIVRTGIVTNVHTDGHLLCKNACVETSIPVFPGMSGGFATLLGRKGAQPFGVISSDPDDEVTKKFDRTIRGASIISLLGSRCTVNADGDFSADLVKARIVQNNEKVMELKGAGINGEVFIKYETPN